MDAHREVHNAEIQSLNALETKVGIDGSADTNSIDYKLSQAETKLGSLTLADITDVTADVGAVNYVDLTSSAQDQLDSKASKITSGVENNLVSIDDDENIKDSGYSVIDDDTMATASDTTLATSESVKAYADIYSKVNFNAPDGFLINGKIVPSVASNNLTVAIKGINGNDPSASNPVYVRIGDTVRSITSALSVTKNAGTNWFTSGSSIFATLERDYFVYLGYNATDGVVVGFATFPYARIYSDFSATSTNEKYAAISTITNAAAGDNYVNIGRFAATLSAGAGYTWTVPTFTNKNLIQYPIFESRYLSFVPFIRGDGTAGTGTYSTQTGLYQIRSNHCYYNAILVWTNITGSPTGALAGTVPLTSAETLSATEQTFINLINVTFPASTIQVFGEMASADTMVHFYAMRDGSTNTAVLVDTTGTARYGGSYPI